MLFTKEQKKIISLTSLGGALEFYDFITFAFFAKILGELFFPNTNPFISLMATWSLFAASYLIRPLGGIVLAHMGDRIGRKKPFLIAVIGMAVSSLLIGFLPNYQTAGIVAPILLIIFRLIQGFCLGAEIPGALVFVSEFTATKNRALVCSLIFFGVSSGLLLGSLLATVLTYIMTPQTLMTWGWRIPFYLGGLLGVLGFYLRRQLNETPLFLKLQREKKQSAFPLKEVFLRYFPQIGQGALVTAFAAVFVSLCSLFMPSYLSTYFAYPFDKAMTLNTVAIFINMLLSVFFGYFADKWSYLKMLRLGALGLLLLSYPLYALLGAKVLYGVIIAILALMGIGSIVISVYTSLIVGLYPTSMRYTGVALVYNLGCALAGGLTPLLMTWLIPFSGDRLIPSFYLMLFAGCTFLISFFMRETQGIALQDI